MPNPVMLRQQKYLFLLLVPGMLYFFIFKYGPMYGVILAFKEFNPAEGILGSPWAGFKYFRRFLEMPSVWQVVYNTLRISVLKIVIGFPAPIIFALLLNEIRHTRYKRFVQTVSYLPHFLSWVVIAGLIFQLLSASYGLYGYLCNIFNWEPQVLLSDPNSFLVTVVAANVWKEMGYGSVIYIATIAGIAPDLYEAAVMDGAGRLKQVLYITLPSILPTVSIMFILRLGGILDAGFDEIFNLYNPMVYGVADIIDTYVYRIGLADFQYSFATAVGVSKSLVAFVLVVGANWIVGKFSDRSIW
jgi:putative aldouronate transport system permease protein